MVFLRGRARPQSKGSSESARRACLLLTALLPALASAAPEDVGVSRERLARVETVLQRYVDEGRLAGGVVWVQRQGEDVLYVARGYRDREAAAPLETDSIFRIASMTKAVVSAATLMLQEEGALLLNDPVGRYLPEFLTTRVAVAREGGGYDIVPATRSITIRDLLTHTAGVSYGDGTARDVWSAAGIGGWYLAGRNEPIRETVRRMAALPFDAQPGERFVYGYSTDILGALIEVVSGVPLDVFLQTRIFEPLGMRDTSFYLPPEKRHRLAVVYRARPDGSLERAPDESTMEGQGEYVDGPRRSFSGGAGLLSTARDYGRFLEALLNGGARGDARILSPSSVKLMTANHVGDRYDEPGAAFGLGVRIVTDVGARGVPGSVGEFGWGGAYHTVYWVDPEEALIVVYFTQLRPVGALDDTQKLRALVYQALIPD